jgi:hypothetical protein
MKQAILISGMSCISLFSFAQNIDAQKGSMQLPGYTGSAAVIISNDVLKVQKDEKVQDFAIKRSGKTIELTNPQDSTAIYNLLQVSSAQLTSVLSDNAGSSTINKMLDVAGKMPDGKLLISQNGTAASATDTVEEEGAQPAAEVAETSTSNTWLWPLVSGVIALIIGFIAGKMMRPSAPVPQHNDNVAPAGAADPLVLQQLQKELTDTRDKNRLITEKTQALISGDELYYNQVFQKIVLPLQEAINQGNQAEIMRQLNIAATHLSSITRTKIRKKLNYDDANVQLITGNPTFTNEFPVIGPDTPIDKIPANIRVLRDILQRNGVTGLDDSIVLGYKLKHI